MNEEIISKKKLSTKAKVGLGLGVLLILGVIGSLLDSPADAKAAPTASGSPVSAAQVTPGSTPKQDSSKLEKAVTAVRENGGVESVGHSVVGGKAVVDLVVSPTIFVSGNNYILTTAGNIERAFRSFKGAGNLRDVELFTVTLKAPMTDKYGNKSQEPVLRYTFRGEELAQINWDNMDQQALLDFAKLEWLHLEGAVMAKEYALEGRHAERAPSFCRVAINGK